MLPDVSIIIPTYNRTRWLAQAIESIICQTYTRIEVIVIDDGSSTHDARNLVSLYPQVQYHYQENQGLGAARNTGLKMCCGEYIQFLDDDDWLTLNSIEEKIKAFQLSPEASLVYSDLFLTDEDGHTLDQVFSGFPRPLPGGDLFERLINKNFIPVHALLWKRSVLNDIGKFPERSGHEDWECLVRAAEENLFEPIDKPLGYYRLHKNSLTRDFSAMFHGKNEVNRYIVSSSRFSRLPASKRSYLLAKYALQQWAYGDEATSKKYLSMASQADPWKPYSYFISGFCLLGKPAAQRLMRYLWKKGLKPWLA